MSDQASSGEPNVAPATPAGAAPVAAASGDRPIGAFGTARGSGLARGKRANTPPTTPATAPVSAYKPTAVEVITPQREYTSPFASETPAPVPANEPAPQAAPVAPAAAEVNAPVTSASEPPAVTAPAAGEPIAAPAEVIQPPLEKAEIKILPPAEAKRPSVSWGDAAQDPQDTRPAREPRGTFQPERRERRPDPRDAHPAEPREPRPFQPREPRPFEPRTPSSEAREQRPQGNREHSFRQPEAAQPKGGFIAWLKGLFGGKPAAQPVQTEERGNRDGEFPRRRHRGGRGRGGYQGDNRGPREGQPRQDFQGGNPNPQGGNPNQEGGEQGQGERRFEGGGRRRRRGGRGRYRDDRGPRPEGQQGGGAI